MKIFVRPQLMLKIYVACFDTTTVYCSYSHKASNYLELKQQCTNDRRLFFL